MYEMVLLIEDNLALSKILTRDLTLASFRVQTMTMNQALAKLLDTVYRVVIVDLDNQHSQWESLLKSLQQQKEKSHLIILSAKPVANLEALKLASISHHMLKKPISNKGLITLLNSLVIPSVSDKKKTTALEKFANLELNDDLHQVRIESDTIHLTKVEYQLLRFLIANKEKPVSRDVILNAIWGFDYDGTTRIVDVHVYHLKTKLKKANVTFKSIRSVGYSLRLD
jgi:two-component system alkaline phosphatase synthesis response regulator PhoP